MALLLNVGDTVSRSYSYTQPSPLHPIQPQECGERTGNLFDSSTIEVGGLSPSTGAETTDNTRRRSGFISVEPSTNYGLSREITSSGSFFWVIAYDENKNIVTDATISAQYSGVLVQGTTLTVNQWTFTTTPTTKYIRWYVTVNNSYKNIMLNLGSTAIPYEPYGYKIPISSNSITTNVYLGEVQSTRRIKKYEFTGLEDWTYSASGNKKRVFVTGFDRAQIATSLCSHFVNTDYVSYPDSGEFAVNAISTTQTMIFGVTDMAITSATDWTTYLAQQYSAGTPVCVWYVLATSETDIVNEPLRKIGTYADEVSGITIPTIAGANTLAIDTTLQPSEVTATYKGWHPVQNVHEAENGAWT